MNRIKHLLQLSSIIFIVMSCSPFRVVSDYDKNVDFSQYKSYTLNLNNLNINDIDKGRVTNELQKQLAMKNMTPMEEASLIINIKANHKKIRDNVVTPNIYLGSWNSWLGWGIGLGRVFSNEYNEGSLIFDFIDAKTGKLVWQSVGSGIRVDSPKSKQEQIPNIIAEMLKNYPPHQK